MIYNVSNVSTGADTDNLYCPTGVVYPDCDAPYATHLESPLKSERVSLKTMLNRWQRTTGKKLTELLVADVVNFFAIPSDSELQSVGWSATSINGFVGTLQLLSAASLAGSKRTTAACIVSTATGLPTGVGAALGRTIDLITVKPYNSKVDYLGIAVTALPATWLTCPEIPDIEFTITWLNHFNSNDRPNL